MMIMMASPTFLIIAHMVILTGHQIQLLIMIPMVAMTIQKIMTMMMTVYLTLQMYVRLVI